MIWSKKRSNININSDKVTKETGIPMIGVKEGAELMLKEITSTTKTL